MRFLKLERRALVTLRSASGGLPGGSSVALTINRDTDISVVSVLQKFASTISHRLPTHFFHYEHTCGEQIRQDLWILEKDMPDADGEYFVCPVCHMPALQVVTVPQQQAEILIGGIAWPHSPIVLPP
jgi:hypothetical protein